MHNLLPFAHGAAQWLFASVLARREIEYKQPTGQTFSCGQPEFVELRLEQEHASSWLLCSRNQNQMEVVVLWRMWPMSVRTEACFSPSAEKWYFVVRT
jgi:hypothetical protein